MLLNARYHQDDTNEQVHSLFEHRIAQDLSMYKPHERQSIKSLEDFIIESKQTYQEFEMSGDVWDFSDDVVEAVENAILTCNQWDLERQQKYGGYNG
jgi:ADP-dependent phosphofructokinase/glucokinase